jgi:hypothetical protein
MKFSLSYFVPFILLFIACYLYKVYLENKISAPNRHESIFSIIMFKKYGMTSLFPLNPRLGDERERKLRRRANGVLLIGYASFIIIVLLSIISK